MRKRFFLLLFSLPLPMVWGQQQDTIAKRDSIVPTETVYDLEEVLFFGSQPVFRNEEDRKKYELLRYRVKRVYPYAKLAADKLYRIEKVLDSLPNNRQRKKYTKRVQEDAEARFTEELKKLSRSQGRILIKLIYRQTGRISVLGGVLFGIIILLGFMICPSRVPIIRRK